MFALNNKISVRQLQALLILDVLGVGITLLPRVTAEYAGQDAWICVLIAAAAAIALSAVMSSVTSRFPDDNFFGCVSKLATKPVGAVICVLFTIKLVISASLTLRLFSEIIKSIMLPETPLWIIGVCMLAISGYSASKGYEARARLGELLLPFVFLPIISVCLVVAGDSDLSNLMPVLAERTPLDIGWGAAAAFGAFSGLDLYLLAAPYIGVGRRSRNGAVGAAVFLGILMTIITAVSVMKFGPLELKKQIWPVLDMMDAVDVPGSMLERLGALVMSFWIVSVFAVVNAHLFFSSMLLRDVCGKGTHLTYIILLMPVLFILSLTPASVFETLRHMKSFNIMLSGAFFGFASSAGALGRIPVDFATYAAGCMVRG
jgi:spore germination protein